MRRPRRNRRLRPGEWSARRRDIDLRPSQGLGPLSEWAVEVVMPGACLVFGVALLFLLFLL